MGTTIEEINAELAASFAELFAREEFAAQLLQRSFRQPEGFDVPTRYLNAETAAALFRFPPDMARRQVEANYLNNQALVAYFEQDWANVIR